MELSKDSFFKKEKIMLTKATLSSEWIYKFYKELENHGIENH